MSRAKHVGMLVFKLVFILLCFAAASVFTVLQNIPLNRFDTLKAPVGLEECQLMAMDSRFEEIGAALSYEIQEGQIVFDLTQSGEDYEDVSVLITYPDFTYDSGAMRAYLEETLGKEGADGEEAYLNAMEEGPWRCYYSFQLLKEGEGADAGNVVYTLSDPDANEHTESFKSADSSERARVNDMYIGKGENATFMLTFGAEDTGALPSGRYVFKADLGVSGLYYEDGPRISFGSTAKILFTTCMETIEQKGLNIFSVNNWLTFYGLMVVLGMFIYLWRDLRAMIKIFCAVMDSAGEGTYVIVHTYINGAYAGSRTELVGGPSIILALIVTVLCYFVFLLSIPLRILIHLIRDIVYLFKEDYELEGFSVIGNILGSVGVYVLIFGFVGLMGAGYLIGGIGTVLGIGMCIAAHVLCKRREEDYG